MGALLRRMQQPSTRLVYLLIGKSVAETLLVGALAVITFLNIFPPFYHGWGELGDGVIAGWAVDNASPWDRVEVQLYLNDQFMGAQRATLSRPDVQQAGWARDEWHGYSFQLPRLGTGSYEARVFALHSSGKRKSLQLLGDPIRFNVDVNGELRASEVK